MRQSQSQSQKAHQPNNPQQSAAIHSDRRTSPETPHPNATSSTNDDTKKKKHKNKKDIQDSKAQQTDGTRSARLWGSHGQSTRTHTYTLIHEHMKSYKSCLAAADAVAAEEGLEGTSEAGPNNFVRKIKTNNQRMRETPINKNK